jgi:hypothetical protein
VAAVGLEELDHASIVRPPLTGKDPGNEMGEMEVTHPHCIPITQSYPPYFGGGPRAYARQRHQAALSLLGGQSS